MKQRHVIAVGLAFAVSIGVAQAQSHRAQAKNVASTADSTASNTRCRSELSPEALDRAASKAAVLELFQQDGQVPRDPVDELKRIARQAWSRSQSIGAARWLADASRNDFEQTDAGRFPTVSLSASTTTGRTEVGTLTTSQGRSSSLGISAGANLYDGGRLKGFTQWRRDLMDASGQSVRAAQEAVVLETITTILERNRYRIQAQVYQQHARKMGCLVEALEAIVAEDRGRASELVQVRKNQAQAELSRDSAVAQSRQIDIKLKRLIGDQFVASENLSAPFTQTPDLGELHRLLEKSPEAMQLKLQADAQESMARAMRDGKGPQINWSVSRSKGFAKVADSNGWQAGVTLTYNLFDSGAEKAGIQAAVARAEASRAQYADFLSVRSERVSSAHDSAKTAFDRAKRYVDILRDSELLRNFTFQQWSQLGRRSLFDLMSAEGDHFSLRIAYVNSLYDGYIANAQLRSMGGGVTDWLQIDSLQ